MKILKISIEEPDLEIINKAASIIKKGGILVYPTDTCYGIGVDQNNKKAISNLTKLKDRKATKYFSVIVSNLKMIKNICQINKNQETILNKYLPGPFTFILSKKVKKETLGIRIPDCLVTQKLSKELNFPYTTTSANLSGEKECYDVACVLNQFKNKKIQPDLILDGGRLPKNPPSTVVNLTCSPPRVLRKGSGDFSN